MKCVLFVLFFIFSFQFSHAEYRAFLLKITKAPDPTSENKSAPPVFRLVRSNLDHLQYSAYYPIEPGETVQYLDTWMCRGRTGSMTPVCRSPREPAATESPETSLESAK